MLAHIKIKIIFIAQLNKVVFAPPEVPVLTVGDVLDPPALPVVVLMLILVDVLVLVLVLALVLVLVLVLELSPCTGSQTGVVPDHFSSSIHVISLFPFKVKFS